jgi:hypothetical protein
MTNVASQAINLADSGIMGHRVQCPMSVDDMNRFFTWHRAAGESAPIGHFTPHEDISGASFSYILANTLSKYYTDIDGVTGGLNFSSAILDANLDPAIRQNGKITANDIIMAYVIYKIYGSSANPTMNVVFNLQDAYDMLPNSVLVESIKSSLQAEEELASAGAVNDMFQDLLSEDPTRFFDAAGKQIPGLFETSTGESATGSWNFVENDRIELNVQFTFINSVTVNSTAGDSEEISSKVVIPAGSTFKIRLQLLATNTPTAAAAIQKAYVAATTEELVRQVAAQKDAAQKAADAFAVATQAIEAAQKQAASAQAAYKEAITRNAKQQKTLASAQAALAAAQAALAAAKTSGNQPNIQQQNAAAIAAKALLENQQAISDLASAELQNAETAIAKATASLNAAQTAAANASAAQAAALAAAANASLALETANAASLASTIASATDASDPLTQALEAEKAAILDPQNLTILLAKANAATKSRKAALNTAVQMFANQTAQLNNYNSVLYNMNSAIATGSNISQLQLYKAMVIGASNIVTSVTQSSKSAASTLAASYTTELTAIQRAALASSNAASLSATVAAANTNSANRSLTAAMNAYVYASTMNASAAAGAAEAQATLNNRVANGAVMTEVQTRTQALLDANKTYAAATSTMNGALAKMTNATNAFHTASTIAVQAKVHISSVAASNLFTLTHYQTSVSTSSAYQANVLSNAKLNQIAIEVNSSLIRLNAADAALVTAEANVSLAQLAINTALAGGAILSEITVLKAAYSKANDSLTQALLIKRTAQAEYDTHTEKAANGQVQLLQSDAMAFYNASITQKQLANDNIIHYSTLLDYAGQHPDAFPPIDGLPASTVYATQLSVWKTYLGNFQTLSDSLLTQFNTDVMRASTLMASNLSISTSLGSLSNYYVASSNSSHLVFQANGVSTLLGSLSNIGLAPPELEADLATYSSQSNAALADTATAYNTFLADSLAAQSISLVSSVGQEILNTASKFQLAQISSATMNTKMNFYNSTLAAFSMLQLEYDQATSVMAVTEQALSNATMGAALPAELTILQQKYANAAATQSKLANKLSSLSDTVSTMNGTLFSGTSGTSTSPPKYQPPSALGLQLWLDASDPLGTGAVPSNGTSLATWKDKSSNNYNAVASGNPVVQRNSLNSLPGIGFLGNVNTSAIDYYTVPIPAGTFSNAMTIFVVYKNTADKGYNALLTRSRPGHNLGAPDIYNGGFILDNSSSPTTFNGYDMPSVYTTNPSLFELTIDQGADAVYNWLAGTAQNVSSQSYNTPLTPSTADANNDTLYIGTRADNNTSFQGVFYEILVYNTVLSTSEREEVEGYLAWKWGLEAQLPTTHSYLLSYPTVAPPAAGFTKVGPTGAGIWTSIAMSSDGKKIIAGGADLMYTSSNSGNTWSPVSGTPINWESVCGSADLSVAYGVTYATEVYKSTDGGATWTSLPTPGGNSHKICCSSNGSIVLIAGFLSAYLSTDGGSTWTSTMTPTQQGTDVAMSADGSVLYYTDFQVGVYVSSNGGATWTQTSVPSLPGGRYNIACSANGATVITSVTGNGVYISRNTGATWTLVSSLPTAEWFSGMAVSGDGTTIAVSAVYGTGLYISKDSGNTWTNVSTLTNSFLFSIAINPSGSIIALPDRDDGIYISNSALASSGSPSPYLTSSALRQAELAVAKKNELIQQANNAYNKYSQLNDRLQAVNESTNSVLDKISVAMAKGADLPTIQPLQTKLSAIQEDSALMYLQSANLYNTFLTLSTLITPDTSFISTVNSTSNATFTATISARLNESAQQLQTAQIEDSAAATALAQANATLTLVSTQFSIKKQQGFSSQEMEPLRSTFTSASLDFANKNILFNFANTSLAQAQSNYDSIYTNYSAGNPSIYTAFANTSNNLVTSLSNLVLSQNKQIASLEAAKSNVLAVELTNAYMSMLNYSTLTQTDYTHYQDLLVKYNTQMEAGNTENVASIYADMTLANNKYLENSQREILYTGAYLSSLSMATIDPKSRDILSATALNQTKVIQGAKANDLYKNLEEANSALFTLNNNFVSAQSAYAIAQSDLQIATANDSSKDVLDIKFSTLVGVSNELTQIQIKFNMAQSAVQLAKSYVSMNPNAQSILDTASAKYLAQANLAQANVLVSQYNAAVANEKEKYDALQTANAALASAQETFNSVIASGADLATIKAARDAQNAAATAATQAALLQNNAMKSLNQALQNANLDQIAQSLIITARLTNENTTAGGTLNGAQVKLNNFSTIVGNSLANLNMAKNAHTTTTSILEHSASPSADSYAVTFVNDLYNVSGSVINNATLSGKTITFINPQVQIYGNDMNYKYLKFSPAEPDCNFYIRLQDPGDSQNTIPWIMFEANNEFSIIDPLGNATYYAPTPYTTSNKFVIQYNTSTSEFEYYKDSVLLYSFPYAVSNPIVWSLLNWLALSSVNIEYAGMGPPGAGLTTQESADIQQITDAATARFVAAQLAYTSAMGEFNNQAILVSSLTQKFSTTTGLLKINTDNNELLYNGFVYNQTYDKYVLLKSFLPIPVIAGAPFNLYSAVVNPINMGVYNPDTRYVLGNLVYHPTSDGAQYMCAVSRDPRGP